MTAPPALIYEERDPPADAPGLADVWRCEAGPGLRPGDPPHRHEVPADVCPLLTLARVPTPGGAHLAARFTPPRATGLVVPVRPGAAYWGVRVRPGWCRAWWGLDFAGGPAGSVDLREVNPATAAEFLEVAGGAATFDAFTRAVGGSARRWAGGRAADPAVTAAVGLAWAGGDGRAPVTPAAMAAAAGVSVRTLQRLFRTEVGLTPTEVLRVRRFRAAAVATLRGATGTAAASDAGYSDQPHWVRECRRVTGHTPTALKVRFAAVTHTLRPGG